MPSPVGHSIAGLVVLNGARRLGVATPPYPGVIVLAASAADLDFVPGILLGDPDRFHHGASHSLLAAAVVGLGAGLLLRMFGIPRARAFGWLVGLAYASHLVLDMLSTDSRPLFGVPGFWPLTDLYVNAPFDVFIDIARSPGAANFVASLWSWHNWYALVREVLVMGAAFVALQLAALGFRKRSAT